MRWCRASAVLIRPAMPAAPSVWPRLPLTEPIAHGVSRTAPCTAPSAAHSMASPRTVPVPWASTNAMCSGVVPARRYAEFSTRSCDQRLGAMTPLLRPSWLTALPRSTA